MVKMTHQQVVSSERIFYRHELHEHRNDIEKYQEKVLPNLNDSKSRNVTKQYIPMHSLHTNYSKYVNSKHLEEHDRDGMDKWTPPRDTNNYFIIINTQVNAQNIQY